MNIWDNLLRQAHTVLIQTDPTKLTAAVCLVQSLHPTSPSEPTAICSDLPTAGTVLPRLTHLAQKGDRHALLLAAVLMRNALRRLAASATPDGNRRADPDDRAVATLDIFFSAMMSAPDAGVCNQRYLYNQTFRRVWAARPGAADRPTDIPLDPTAFLTEAISAAAPVHRRPVRHTRSATALDSGHSDTDTAFGERLIEQARRDGVITDLEHRTLEVLYLNSASGDLTAAADELNASTDAIKRRSQRAIRKLKARRDTLVLAAAS